MKTANEILLEKRGEPLPEAGVPTMLTQAQKGLDQLALEIQASLDVYSKKIARAASYAHPSSPGAPEVKKRAQKMTQVLKVAAKNLKG